VADQRAVVLWNMPPRKKPVMPSPLCMTLSSKGD
jgi:hypothetical protein